MTDATEPEVVDSSDDAGEPIDALQDSASLLSEMAQHADRAREILAELESRGGQADAVLADIQNSQAEATTAAGEILSKDSQSDAALSSLQAKDVQAGAIVSELDSKKPTADQTLSALQLVGEQADEHLEVLRTNANQEIASLGQAREQSESHAAALAQLLQKAKSTSDSLDGLLIHASRSAQIGNHSDTAGEERTASLRWRRITMTLWALLISLSLGAALILIFGPTPDTLGEYLATRGAVASVLLSVGLAIRYAGNRAEDHRIQELMMTHVALSIRSSEGFAKAIDGAEGESNGGKQFLSSISSTLFKEPINTLKKRAEAHLARRPRFEPRRLLSQEE